MVLRHYSCTYNKATKLLRMMYSIILSDTGILGKKSEGSYQESNLRPSDYCCSSDALPLSYRRPVGAKAIKLGLWDKYPAYCEDAGNVLCGICAME